MGRAVVVDADTGARGAAGAVTGTVDVIGGATIDDAVGGAVVEAATGTRDATLCPAPACNTPPQEPTVRTTSTPTPIFTGATLGRLWCAVVPRPGRHFAVLFATGFLTLGLLAACSSTPRIAARHTRAPTVVPSSSPTLPVSTTPVSTTPSASPTTPTDTHPPAVTPASPVFVGTVANVSATQVSGTWRPGCPVGPADLRLLTMSYWGFDGQPHTGTMVVNGAVASAVLKVFDQLFAEQFPIHQMQPADAYGGSDPVSMADDNTSGFNCRLAVATGPPSWSVHAYGEAIDVNPVENPYLEGGAVQPPAGAPFLIRTPYRPGMAVPGGQLVAAFASVGWLWGGRWTSSPDYQHFSATGG